MFFYFIFAAGKAVYQALDRLCKEGFRKTALITGYTAANFVAIIRFGFFNPIGVRDKRTTNADKVCFANCKDFFGTGGIINSIAGRNGDIDCVFYC